MTNRFPAPVGPECFRGNVNTWECDEMGHMNVRFYVVKGEEAASIFLSELGVAPSFLAKMGLRQQTVDYHVRFLAEMHPGAGVYGHAAVVEATPEQIRIFVDLRHAIGGHPAATLNLAIKLKDVDERFVPWPEDVLTRAREHLLAEIPPHGQPKSLHLDPSTADASRARTEELGLHQINLGVVHSDQCDGSGEMKGEWFMGRVSDGIGNLIRTFNPNRGKKGSNVGGAALEYRIIIHRRPKAGDILAVRSGLAGIGAKTFRMGHWMIDMVTGEAVATMEASAASFDLTERKIIPIDDEKRAEMEQHIVKGLVV